MNENPATIIELLEDPYFFNAFEPKLLKIPSDKSQISCEKTEYNDAAYEKISEHDYLLSYKKCMNTSIALLGHIQIFATHNKFYYTDIKAVKEDLISDPNEVKKILAQHKRGEVKVSSIYRQARQRTSYIKDCASHFQYKSIIIEALKAGLCLEKVKMENASSQAIPNISQIFTDNELLAVVKQNTAIEYLKTLFKESALKLAEEGSLHFIYARYDHEQQTNITEKYNSETNKMGTLNLFNILKNPLLEFTKEEIANISTEILLKKADRTSSRLEFNQDITPFFLDFSTKDLKNINQKLNQKNSVRQDSFIDSIKELQKSLTSEDVEFDAEIIIKGKVNINKLHQKIAPQTSMQFIFDPYHISHKHTLETLNQITNTSNINFMNIVGRYINMAQEIINENFNNENKKNKDAFFYTEDGAQFVFHFGSKIDDKTAKDITRAIYENISTENLSNDAIAKASIQKVIIDNKIKKVISETTETEDQLIDRKNSFKI